MKLALSILIVLIAVLVFINFQFTGFLVLDEREQVKNWTFANPEEYTYNSSLVNFSSGIKLKEITNVYNFTNTTLNQYTLTKALYDPSDKLDKIQALDGEKFTLDKNKIFDIFFSSNLENGDLVSIYLKSGDAANFQICKISELCSAGFGSGSYNGSGDQWINITLSGLATSTNLFSVNTSKDLKIDYIVSSKGSIVAAYYDPSDKLDKLQSQDGDRFEIDKNKLLNIFFNDSLNSGYVVNFYLKGDESNLTLCQLYDCSKSYGIIYYTGTEGWFDVTLNIESATNSFSLNTTKDVKIDYINSTFLNQTNYSITNTSFPSSGSADTQDLNVPNLNIWGIVTYSQQLNGQNASYQYSTDSGSTWTTVGDLSNLTSKRIRFRINLESNQTHTPAVDYIQVNYTTLFSSVQGTITYKSTGLINLSFNTTHHELISSATAYIKYSNGTSIGSVNLTFNNQTNLFESTWNSTGLSAGLYYIDVKATTTYLENLDQRQLLALLSSVQGAYTNSSLSFTKNQTTRLDLKDVASTTLDIVSLENLTNISLSVVEYENNIKSENQKTEMKFLDIVGDQLSNNISQATVTVHYTDQDIQENNLVESSLKIYYYNESSGWQQLESIVNETGNYVSANISHFSTYGIFGDQVQASSSTSGGGGDSSTNTETTKTVNVSTETKSVEREELRINKNQNTEKKIYYGCNYNVSFSLLGGRGVIENLGTCNVESIEIQLSENLVPYLSLSKNSVESLEVNKTESFDIIQKEGTVVLAPLTGLVVSSENTYTGSVFVRIPEDNLIRIKELPISVKVNQIEAEKPEESVDNLFILSTAILLIIIVLGIYTARKAIKSF